MFREVGNGTNNPSSSSPPSFGEKKANCELQTTTSVINVGGDDDDDVWETIFINNYLFSLYYSFY